LSSSVNPISHDLSLIGGIEAPISGINCESLIEWINRDREVWVCSHRDGQLKCLLNIRLFGFERGTVNLPLAAMKSEQSKSNKTHPNTANAD
jgi:hypothetical protein